MIETPIMAAIKQIAIISAGPIIGLFAWIGKRLHRRVDQLEHSIKELDKSHAVQQSQLRDIKEDVHEINKKLDKILDRVSQNNGS